MLCWKSWIQSYWKCKSNRIEVTMGEIIGFAIFFKVLFFAFLIFLTMLINKMFKIEKIEKDEWIAIGVMALIDLLSGTLNIYVKQYFLFYLLMLVAILLLVYSYIRNKRSIFSFMSIYSIFLVITSVWGFTFALDSVNIFKVYILSILVSPITPTNALDLRLSLIIAILMHVFSLLGMLILPKIKEKVLK